MLNLFKKTDRIGDFWKWFSQHQSEFRDFKDPSHSDEYLEKILEQTRKISEGLAFEIQPPQNNVIVLTVSADGNVELFETVEKIIQESPKIDGWEFVAFRQRVSESQARGMVLRTDEFTLDPKEIKFKPIVDGKDLGIIIYVKGVSPENRDQIAYGCLMLVDNILGEYDAVKKVKEYDIRDLVSDSESLHPLTDIAKYVDEFYKD